MGRLKELLAQENFDSEVFTSKAEARRLLQHNDHQTTADQQSQEQRQSQQQPV
jgi:hypothetical protein